MSTIMKFKLNLFIFVAIFLQTILWVSHWRGLHNHATWLHCGTHTHQSNIKSVPQYVILCNIYIHLYDPFFFVETLQGEPEIQLLQLHDQSIWGWLQESSWYKVNIWSLLSWHIKCSYICCNGIFSVYID